MKRVEIVSIKCAFASLGCAKNLVDTENMIGTVKAADIEVVANEKDADVIIVNTCAFIEDAAQESVDRILELAEHKKAKAKCLIVTGCLPERYKSALMDEIKEIDAVIGTGEFDKIIEVITRCLRGEKHESFASKGFLAKPSTKRLVSTPNHYAYLKIAEGCSNRCTYCLIPSLRGDFRSRPLKELLNEASVLAANGVKELMVIAQDTTRYGEDIYGTSKLGELLKELDKVDGLDWIRVMYGYPSRVSDELIDVMTSTRKVLKYIDLPMQHGSDEILSAMNRPFSSKKLIETVSKMRKAMPDLVLRTTFIVGFPGEKERHIDELLAFIDEIKPERAGVFKYSREEGSPAYDFNDQVLSNDMDMRLDRVMRKLKDISYEYQESRIGSIEDVYIEGRSDESDIVMAARSYAEAPDVDGKIYIGDVNQKIGQKVRVKITKAKEYDLAAELV